MEEPKRHKVNVNYAIYSPDDKFIIGFDGLKDIDKYFGHKRYGSITHMKRVKEKVDGKPAIYKYYDEKNDIYECSVKFFEYVSNVRNKQKTNFIEKGLTVFKFWEEISDERFRSKEY